jgi:signal transduction histidine kinase
MRNPLSSVKLNLQALRTAAALTPAQTELTEIAADQASRLERMLTDLLKYGRPLNVEQGPTLFRNLCRDAISDVQSLVDEKHVTIRVTDDLDATPLMVDAELIRRALTNLLANAVQAVASGGEVTVAARPSTSVRSMADVFVADNGPGIPKSSADRLFQPFFTTREGGTGLGLANVRKIVEYHGGTASAENSDRGGAVFSISLPLGGETQ